MGVALIRARAGAALLLVALALSACSDSSGGTATSAPASNPPQVPQMTVTSADLSSGTVPRDLTCDGANRKPTVSLVGIPSGTKSIALEMLDPDAPSGNFTHWLAFADGATGPSQPAFPPASAVEGQNDAGGSGYTGPCPPKGAPHHYHLMLFAVGFGLGPGGANLTNGFSRSQLDAAINSNRGPVLARGDLVATYSRA